MRRNSASFRGAPIRPTGLDVALTSDYTMLVVVHRRTSVVTIVPTREHAERQYAVVRFVLLAAESSLPKIRQQAGTSSQ